MNGGPRQPLVIDIFEKDDVIFQGVDPEHEVVVDVADAEGQAALVRHDYDTAEAAAREVLGNRQTARNVDAQMLLADSLAGRRNWGAAAVAYDDAFQRSKTGARAPEALVGLANSFVGLGNKRDACNTLDDLRSNFPNLRGLHAERAATLRTRAGCR